MVKNPPAMQETWVWSMGWEDSLEKGKVTHSNILSWSGEGKGYPLQHSFLEHSNDKGAWKATFQRVGHN